MGGRIHGFLGGVLLTSTITYLTKQYIVKNSLFISDSLRSSNYTIQNKILSNKHYENLSIPNKHTTDEIRSFNETCKDLWNEEIIKMVNWVYGINWYKIGMKIDEKTGEISSRLVESLKKE
ncbi:unnamed protein product [Candida verbasci]|uniref:MICOS complex subunit MIC12 n=1 Tax=Candida verbasci TaxID=1227364 RepID=A0A9W4XJE7_9ASCO|nr:unnamed protein product [Candida verbasci]